jgi:long-chain-fatty-acid--[acyl-carrier-protein] ligase
MTGLRVAYYPNPNESRRVAKSVAKWGATIAAGTPTFLRSVLKAGDPSLFASLRTLVSGAEKAPQELFELVSQYGLSTQVLEGYGITECAPVVSVTPPGEPRLGVGRPLPGVTVQIVHPDTLTPVPPGSQGLVLIRGANVFPGYLDPQLNPFVEIGDKRWYNSGDLGKLVDGSLVITGRLKRFIKIAGEMVSLSAVEEALQPHVPSPDGTPTLAVLPKGAEGETRPLLILFTSGSLSRDRANEVLHTSGFPHLVHISEVRNVKVVPLLGSGKTDYQSLKTLL